MLGIQRLIIVSWSFALFALQELTSSSGENSKTVIITQYDKSYNRQHRYLGNNKTSESAWDIWGDFLPIWEEEVSTEVGLSSGRQ